MSKFKKGDVVQFGAGSLVVVQTNNDFGWGDEWHKVGHVVYDPKPIEAGCTIRYGYHQGKYAQWRAKVVFSDEKFTAYYCTIDGKGTSVSSKMSILQCDRTEHFERVEETS